MKMTKALALLLAIAMVVVCFNMPANCENPWDNEGVDPPAEKFGIIIQPDSVINVNNPDNPTEADEDDVEDIIDPGLILQIQFIINFQVIPNFNLEIYNN